ncbi:hypothetical protein AB0K52_17555 [Glycomyces sp. NPDC049804]|uniref:hypothetical protein n=1 Tax=Glycomyces sp. NPDC049804 TaxID=3154363 RepID=UPI003420A309
MTIEVQRTRVHLIGDEVFWLHRIAPDPQATIAIRRNGRLAVSWEAGFKEESVAYAALTMAFDDFLGKRGRAS